MELEFLQELNEQDIRLVARFRTGSRQPHRLAVNDGLAASLGVQSPRILGPATAKKSEATGSEAGRIGPAGALATLTGNAAPTKAIMPSTRELSG